MWKIASRLSVFSFPGGVYFSVLSFLVNSVGVNGINIFMYNLFYFVTSTHTTYIYSVLSLVERKKENYEA